MHPDYVALMGFGILAAVGLFHLRMYVLARRQRRKQMYNQFMKDHVFTRKQAD